MTGVSVAASWSHMTISTTEEPGGLLHQYSLPLDSWVTQMSQLTPVTEEVVQDSSVSLASSKPHEEVYNQCVSKGWITI